MFMMIGYRISDIDLFHDDITFIGHVFHQGKHITCFQAVDPPARVLLLFEVSGLAQEGCRLESGAGIKWWF